MLIHPAEDSIPQAEDFIPPADFTPQVAFLPRVDSVLLAGWASDQVPLSGLLAPQGSDQAQGSGLELA